MSIISKPHGDFTNNVDVANATYVNDQMNTAYNAINGGLDSTNVPTLGDVATLVTSAKGSAVAAINEIFGYPTNSVTRQSVINGVFSFNQRVVSGTVILTAGQYGHDRWKAGSSGCTYTFATSANITTITITAGSLIQVIEGLNLFTGTYTLSWTGTAQGKIGAGSYGASGIAGSATGGANLNIEFNVGTLSKVQFNVGGTALPFQPRSFAEEFALCRRYYEKSYDVGTNPGSAVGNGAFQYTQGVARSSGGTYFGEFSTAFHVPKRVQPTVTLYSTDGTVNAIRNASTGLTVTGGALSLTVGQNAFAISSFATISSTINVGDGLLYQFTADAEL